MKTTFSHLSNPNNFKQPDINQTALLLSVLISQRFAQNQEKEARQNRLIYRSSDGKNNKIVGAINRERVSKSKILSKKILESPSPKLSSQELKQELEKQKANGDFIRDIDFSNNDLSDFDLSNLTFSNCNFSNCKMPSMSHVSIDNNCNLENSDWSHTTQNFVRFGSDNSRNKVDELVNLGNFHQIIHRNISTFDEFNDIKVTQKEVGFKTHQEVEDSIKKITDNHENHQQLLNAKNANFSGVNFQTFVVFDADFDGANFADAQFRINQGNRGSQTSLLMQNAQNYDFSRVTFDFYDNQGVKKTTTRGSKSFDMSKIPPYQRDLYATSGLISEEYREMMKSDKTIYISVNADVKKIPTGLLFQSISDKVTTSELANQEKIEEIENKAINIGNNLYGRYNIKFVNEKDLKDQEADFYFHINIVKGIDTAVADNTQSFTLGAKESFFAIDEALFARDFDKNVAHEMGHVFLFQHPMGNAEFRLPALMSYTIPSANKEGTLEESKNNILPIMNFTPIEQKLIESHMEEVGRKPKIAGDLSIKFDKETLGIYSSYNPDKKFSNFADFSTIKFDDNEMNLVVMDAKKALSFCQAECEYAIGLDDDKAVMMVSKKTGIVHAMAILSGENPRLKISDELVLNFEDLYNKNGYGIISKDSNGDFVVQKFQENKQVDSELLSPQIPNKHLTAESLKKEGESSINSYTLAGIVALSALAIKTKQILSRSATQSIKTSDSHHIL